jgi:hypothetical protein
MQGGGIIAVCAGRKRCVPPTRRRTGRLGSRPPACELRNVGVLGEGACHVASSESSETRGRFEAIASALASEPNVSVGSAGKKGFGSSALQVGGKIFAMVSSSGSFVVKLPKDRVEELERLGCGQRFDPGHGRLMKEWLSLNTSSGEDWLSLAKEALRFVASKS